MRKKLILTILIAAFMSMFVIQPDLSALDDTSSLECDGGTVSPGDAEDSVRDKCGDPQKVTRKTQTPPLSGFTISVPLSL